MPIVLAIIVVLLFCIAVPAILAGLIVEAIADPTFWPIFWALIVAGLYFGGSATFTRRK